MPAADSATPTSRREDALWIVERLVEAGYVAYFAGGCVRDQLLGLEPKDYDVATDAPPDRVRLLFRKTQSVGASFGVILVRHGRSVIEVATFRADGSYSDGRRPDRVRFATPAEDAWRRDFTINGLYFDPLGGRVIDHVGGQADLSAKVLRSIGDPPTRFAEDYLRMLRAPRFAARFGLTIEPATRAAIVAHATKLTQIAPERVGDELRAMLTSPARHRAAALLHELGLTPVLLRQLKLSVGSGDTPLLQRVLAGQPIPFGTALAVWMTDFRRSAGATDLRVLLGPAALHAANAVARATLRISNEESSDLAGTLDSSALLENVEPGVARMKRYLARPTSLYARSLLAALHEVDPRPRIAWLLTRFADLLQTQLAPPPLLTGDMLVEAGYKPGPAFSPVIDGVYDAQLESRITTARQAVELAHELMKSQAPAATK